ncbi:dicarboxylate/amino acid:cation symporter [Methylobacterium nodulans]|uniref:Sodium:dicarboxylate symporter n=1 Tax=Methylobacterium nodulans (strain LMG 21967 / CNCM I-2342 / ORS 2060) TaxID=460265 RepID=B8IWE2_METNO|nr:dicarboxylate/amino acid:cation symporter [Methylobacterium nodulans]ACL62732.1 sodium:dicarboxylate symporter [Methylobacterium nodulans ORS 2060]
MATLNGSLHDPRRSSGPGSGDAAKRPVPIYKRLYPQVLFALAAGIALGHFYPGLAEQMKPFGDGFIKMIKMMIGPVIFITVSVGIAKMGDLKEVGRVGLKALIYFEILTTLALVIGLVVGNVLKPGVGINADPATLDASSITGFVASSQKLSTVDFLLHIIPTTFFDAFAKGEILQVLFVAVLFGVALSHFSQHTKLLVKILEEASHGLFGIIGFIMRIAPLGAFGAMAFTVGKYGIGSLQQVFLLVVGVYVTCIAFVFLVLGFVARLTGFSLWRFLVYIKEEIFVVIGTSSSETVLPRMLVKMEKLGCAKPVVGLVLPTGYSFNLDGTCVYLTMAALFIAQAFNIDLTLGEQLSILGVMLLTSKGAAAVSGAAFVTLAASMSSIHHLPVSGLALLLGVDRILAEVRAVTNLIGNGVGTLAISKWENALDTARMQQVLSGEAAPTAEEAEQAENTGTTTGAAVPVI